MKDVPVGFLMTLAENEAAMRHFALLSEDQRAQIIDRASHASSRKEMRDIVHGLGASPMGPQG